MTTRVFFLTLWLGSVWAACLWFVLYYLWQGVYQKADEDREQYDRVEQIVSKRGANTMRKLKYLVLETRPKKKRWRYRTTNRFWFIVGILVLIFILYAIANTSATSVYWAG